MRPRNTIIALILLLIVGGYAYIVANYSRTEKSGTLLGIKQDDIAKIELHYSDRDIVIERDKGGPWRLVKPIGGDADPFQSTNLARAISDCRIVSTVDEKPADLAPYGLANPQTIVTVTTFDKKTFPGIAVGRNTPVGFNTYIRFTDKPAVMLTESVFRAGMNKTVNDLRDRDLMSFKMDDVQKLTIGRDNGAPVEIERTGDNWKIVKPTASAADDTRVREALSTLINAKAADFVNDRPASVTQYGLEKPHVTATVLLKNGEQQSLLFGFKRTEAGKSGIYVRRGERTPVYAVPEYVMSALDASPLDFRDKTILSVDPAAVDTVRIKTADSQFMLKRAAVGKWDVVSGGNTSEGDIPVVERLLSQLRNFKGTSIVADPMPSAQPFGLDNPALQITLLGKDGKELGSVKLARITVAQTAPPIRGEPSGPRSEYYAESSASKAVFALTDFSFTQLNKPAALYLAKAPPVPAPAASPK